MLEKIPDILTSPEVAAVVGAVVLAVLLVLKYVVLPLAKKQAESTPTKLDDQVVDFAQKGVDAALKAKQKKP